jgi:uracil-DNA glycosylase
MKPTLLSSYVQAIRIEKRLSVEVPDFDPNNGNETAKYLFILEAPGPKAVKSGYVTFDNPDLTASNLKSQLQAAKIDRSEIAVWNIVPWYVGNEDKSRIRAVMGTEVEEGIRYLLRLLQLLPNLRCIVLVGGAARKAHVPLSAATTSRILSCHHPSPRAMNLLPTAAAENVAVFKNMQRLAG